MPFWNALCPYGFAGHKGVYEYLRGKLLATVCTLAKTLCITQLFVFLWPSITFSFPYFSLLSLSFLHSLHCDCSANARLKKMSFLFYCIILPFDLVMLNRSYNVESAKSVLFSKVCSLLKMLDLLCNTHITKRTECFTWYIGATVKPTATMCSYNNMTCPFPVLEGVIGSLDDTSIIIN